MRPLILSCLTLLFFTGCQKPQIAPVACACIDIYLLQSSTTTVDPSTNPATVSITDAVLEPTPLVADRDIVHYTRATKTFHLRKDIQTVIQNYGPEKAFAVTLDGQPVYYGRFHPLHLSSMTFGIATIAPLMLLKNELRIDFAIIGGNPVLQQLDKRNDSRITNALDATGRLR